MEEDAACSQHSVYVVDGLLYVSAIQAVQGRLLDYAVELEVRPLLGDIDPFPLYPPLQVPLLTLLLVDERPAEVRTNQVLVPPLEQTVQHPTLPTSQLQHLRTVVYKLSEEFLDDLWLHVPVIDFLLF